MENSHLTYTLYCFAATLGHDFRSAVGGLLLQHCLLLSLPYLSPRNPWSTCHPTDACYSSCGESLLIGPETDPSISIEDGS